MRDYIELGPVPAMESCQQVGSSSYDSDRARAECVAYRHQLERVFPNPPDGASFSIKTFQHEFGSYREVVVYYDDDKPDSVEYAFGVEANSPENWDADAKRELGIN